MKKLLFFTILFVSVTDINAELIEEPERLTHESYFEVGVTAWIPAGLNINAGYWYGRVGIRLSGGYWDWLNSKFGYGYQCNINYKLSENKIWLHNLGFIIGKSESGPVSSEEPCCDWTYIGFAYDMYYKGFFLEAQLQKPIEVRRGSFKEIVPLFQLGYIKRFLP
jgi:hypothetical protein